MKPFPSRRPSGLSLARPFQLPTPHPKTSSLQHTLQLPRRPLLHMLLPCTAAQRRPSHSPHMSSQHLPMSPQFQHRHMLHQCQRAPMLLLQSTLHHHHQACMLRPLQHRHMWLLTSLQPRLPQLLPLPPLPHLTRLALAVAALASLAWLHQARLTPATSLTTPLVWDLAVSPALKTRRSSLSLTRS